MALRLALLGAGALLLSGCGLSEQFATSRAYNFATVTHGSEHINPGKDFNEYNPGFGLGSEVPIRRSPYIFGVEAGRFRNSLDEYSSYVATYMERKFEPETGPRQVGFGAFFGYAEYASEVQRAEDRGFVTFGDFVPVVGLQTTIATVGPHEFRFRITSGLDQSDGLITLQSNFRF